MRLLTPYWSNQNFAADIFNELDRRTAAERFAAPAYDVQENEQHYLIETDLPGVKKEDIKIDLHESVLTITGERKRDGKAESFKRSFSVPDNVDLEKIEAQHENGVLSVYLPKGAAAKPRTIEIQNKSGGFFEKLTNSPH
ncbi:MAG: Hsp20/alpha crystallin family protein [Bdellovibrio sp.]|nr:Hsp20/alpha crystallin family protein [Bdellovibrio sp.]